MEPRQRQTDRPTSRPGTHPHVVERNFTENAMRPPGAVKVRECARESPWRPGGSLTSLSVIPLLHSPGTDSNAPHRRPHARSLLDALRSSRSLFGPRGTPQLTKIHKINREHHATRPQASAAILRLQNRDPLSNDTVDPVFKGNP